VAEKATSAKLIKSKTIKAMKSLGIYKKEYDPLIDIYADLNFQYNEALEEFDLSGRAYETETAAGGSKKSAIIATLESLRKDILAYSDRLCLNPKSLETVTAESGKTSRLATVLKELGR
jgi:hypothetical protein